MGAPSSRALALGAAFLLLLVALPSAFLYLTSSAATRATLLDLKPFSARRQHSVEYWMMASLQDGGAGPERGREAVRVRDPDAADAFFVPFFSSLSFNVHGRNMTDPDTEADRLLQVELVDILWKSKYWQRSAGRDHVIPMHHPNAFRFLRAMVNASILIVSDFGRYTKELASLRKDVVAPYVHVVGSFLDDDPPDPFEARHTLLFFRGRTVRKDEGKIRSKLEKILKGKEGVRFEDSIATGDGINISTEGMRSSKFCLHPAGDTPSSCRLFDAIVSHCVPVIVSSRIELPFEDEIDYISPQEGRRGEHDMEAGEAQDPRS
uniref:Exostosin GT47 domain-containing protein n=1 Tax=Zea mays TaxID=4577 RepID=A0A804N8I8_MAIZE